MAGSSSLNQGQFTVIAGGADIWGQSDQFHFVYQQVSGDVDVIARVDSVTQVHSWSKMGVMIRSSLAANAAHGYALVSAGKGTAFQNRASVGARSNNTYGPAAKAPYWVRLVRVGTKVTAYASADGNTWTTINSATIALGTVAYVGLATTSHNASAATTAKASAVAVQPLSLPSPQKATDIGNPAVAGSVAYSQGVYQQRAGGTDIWGTSDQFHFIYQPVNGDVEVIARVRALGATDGWAKSGVMIRETLSANARHASAFATAWQGYAFQRRVDPGNYSDHTAGPAASTPGWVRLVRTGSQIDAYQSVDGVKWTAMGSDAIPMAATVYVGIATTSHNATTPTDAMVDNLSIKAASGPGNQLPQVSITAPANGANATAGGDITVSASASDADGTVARVDFFAGSTPLGSVISQPYTVTWSAVPAGTYTLTAVAVDNAGGSTTSAPVTVQVTASANKPPTVTLTAPAAGKTYTAPASVAITATAADSDGTVARVEFYNGTTLLNSDTSAPYSFTWSSVPTGTYAIKAVAFDNAGASASSATVTITVGTAANKPPTVTLTAPAAGATYTAPASVAITATAADSDGTVARVEFYSGTTLLNSDTTAPYAFTWSSVPTGTYAIKAVAYDNSGASVSSATRTITVGAAPVGPPTGIVFQASPDHATLVTSYELRVFASGANPATATPVATSNLAKPTPAANGDITVDRSAFFSGLAAGNYLAAVRASGSGGMSANATIAFTR
ncbi:MAG: Ig-like domain-containing protein [Acidobacteriota bacterium]